MSMPYAKLGPFLHAEPPSQNHFPTFTYALHTHNTHDSLHVLSRSFFQQS